MNQLIYGVAYYDEYMPIERLDKDFAMMQKAGINTIRIAESTWSTEEPTPGVFDFSHIDRVLAKAEEYGINVIIGTPTYAVPVWLVELDPDVLATTAQGRGKYGPRQIMDITNETYRTYAERIIRKLAAHTAQHPSVIGFQLDNETKHYNTSGPKVQAAFRSWLETRYETIEALNQAFGFAYWSNSVTSFQQLPDVTSTINGSYAAAFAEFQRKLAADFLLWQSGIIREYARADQFITHNMDYFWRTDPQTGRGCSYGLQPDINHYAVSQALTLAGTDIYHFSQDRLDGQEIAYGGDEMRPLKHAPYLVLETEAQAFLEWVAYPGQLRLQAWSHIASGARGIMYWHWHSIHNSMETYWKGLLSHDYSEGAAYREACTIGRDFARLSEPLSGLTKHNDIAILVSNEALSAEQQFPTGSGVTYDDILMGIHKALYQLNLECDVVFVDSPDWDTRYQMLITPCLYTAEQSVIDRLRAFVQQGGTLFSTFRSFFTDESVQVRHEAQPYGLTDVFGMTYDQFTAPSKVTVDGDQAKAWMELIRPCSARVMASYSHKYWWQYAAATRHSFGAGTAWYLGCWLEASGLKKWIARAAAEAGIQRPGYEFPLIRRVCTNAAGETITFLFNYSDHEQMAPVPGSCTELLSGAVYKPGDMVHLPDWGTAIFKDA